MLRPTIRQESPLPKHIPSTGHDAVDQRAKHKKKRNDSKVVLLLIQVMTVAALFFYIGFIAASSSHRARPQVTLTPLVDTSKKSTRGDDANVSTTISTTPDDNSAGGNNSDGQRGNRVAIDSTRIIKRPICSTTRHLFRDDDDMASLVKAYTEAEAFHNDGGNLKRVETYLNGQIDTTLKMLNIEFTPHGSNAPLGADESVTARVKELLQSKDVHKRGGYDQRNLPGSLSTNNEDLFSMKRGKRDKFDVLEPFNTERWNASLGPIARVCKSVDIIRAGKEHFENKFMCSFDEIRTDATTADATNTIESPIKSQSEANSKPNDPCEIISIGSNGEWGFETVIAKSTDCITHTFDCTVKDDPHKPDAESIHFYPFCISDKRKKIEDREYLTYSQIIEKTGMTKPPALFKMDVEGFEYDVLIQMLDEAAKSGSKDLLPSQISVELHYATRMYDIPWMLRYRQAAEISMFMGVMYRRGGYMPMNVDIIGRGCYSCSEILFGRIFCDEQEEGSALK